MRISCKHCAWAYAFLHTLHTLLSVSPHVVSYVCVCVCLCTCMCTCARVSPGQRTNRWGGKGQRCQLRGPWSGRRRCGQSAAVMQAGRSVRVQRYTGHEWPARLRYSWADGRAHAMFALSHGWILPHSTPAPQACGRRRTRHNHFRLQDRIRARAHACRLWSACLAPRPSRNTLLHNPLSTRIEINPTLTIRRPSLLSRCPSMPFSSLPSLSCIATSYMHTDPAKEAKGQLHEGSGGRAPHAAARAQQAGRF